MNTLATQRELGLRHYDVKLLNFFLASPPIPAGGEGELILTYGYGGSTYRIALPSTQRAICMLADFGTANIAGESMGQPITEAHFTTLENTPPDFLLCGSEATQGMSGDSFSLALCWLHLLTGRAPYEELVTPLLCPAELKEALQAVWMEGGEMYEPVRRVLEGDEEGVLYHTLYRYLCLFGPMVGQEEGRVKRSAAWAEIERWLGSSRGKKTFGRDHAAWSVFKGKQKVMEEAQRRMAEIPGR